MVSVIGMLVGAVVALYLGIIKTIAVISTAITQHGEVEPAIYNLFEALDCFLIATALLVLAVGIYELFVSGLEVPDWMLVKNLTELKAKFGFVIIPVMAVKFVQKILKYENAIDTLYYGAAIALVALALTAFNYVSLKEKEVAEDPKIKEQEEKEIRAADLDK